MDVEWFDTLVRLLRPGGILVVNMIEPEKVSALPLLRDRTLKKRLPESIMYQIDGYENRVLAFSDRPFEKEDLKFALRSICREYPRCYGVAKRYHSSAI
jgi:predicted O-methyltransferase YrrM